MDNVEFQDTVKELRDKGFVNHEIVIDRWARIYGFATRGGFGQDSVISYYPEVLGFLNKSQLQFILLHEEGHCNSLLGSLPHIGEDPAQKYAKKYIQLIDKTIDPDNAEKSAGLALGEYRRTIPLNIFQRFIRRIPIIGKGFIGYLV